MTLPAPLALRLATALVVLAGCGSGGAPAPTAPAAAQADTGLGAPASALEDAVVGQTVYVPVYSHIFHQDGSHDLDLTATLSVRNTDPDRAITVEAVGYYDSDGRLVRRYAERPFRLGPLASEAFVVGDRDRTGGVGANFLVAWHAAAEASPPVIEAVMVSTAQSQGISLTSRGQVVRSLGE